MAVRARTRPTFRSCSISSPSRVSTSARRPRSESSQSSSPRSLRPWRCAPSSPSFRWKPGDECQYGVPPPLPDLESFVVGGGLVGGVHLLLPRPVDVAGVPEDGAAGCQLAANELFAPPPRA